MFTREERHIISEEMDWLMTGGYWFDLGNVASGMGIDLSKYSDPNDLNLKVWMELIDLIEPEPITGDTSDGYHTFNELYDHRAKLFSVIVSCFKDKAWKSKKHNDGTMYDGMFIVGIDTPEGQATYHYDIDPYWELFDCKELEKAPKWDGHTPSQAIDRILSMKYRPEQTCHLIDNGDELCCSVCDCRYDSYELPYCGGCGSKVVK